MQVVTCKNAVMDRISLKTKPRKACIVKMQQRLIDAARIEFSQNGIECATTRGIAERAECHEVTLFRHFESKQKLLLAVVQGTADEFRKLSICCKKMTGDLSEDLKYFAEVYNDTLEHCEGMARALIGEGKRHPTLAKELIGDVLKPFHQSIAKHLEILKKQGLVKQDLNPTATAEIFTATLMSGMLRRTSGLSALSRDEWITQTAELFAIGIAPH
jgi:AcrR family transcriptional regulator